MMQPNLENLQNSMRRITKVYENIKINDSDSRILGIPTEIPSVANIINFGIVADPNVKL